MSAVPGNAFLSLFKAIKERALKKSCFNNSYNNNNSVLLIDIYYY